MVTFFPAQSQLGVLPGSTIFGLVSGPVSLSLGAATLSLLVLNLQFLFSFSNALF